MTARLNPNKCKYYPEVVPESIAVVPTASGTSIASYANFSPYSMFLQEIFSSNTPNVTLRVDNDSGHAVIESPLPVRPPMQAVMNEIVSHASMDLWAVGTGLESQFTYCNKVLKMSVYEKIKYGLSLDDSEKALANEFDIVKKVNAGTLQKSQVIPPFKKIIEVVKEVTVVAGSNTRVGRMINVRSGQKAVLLGVAVNASAVQTKFGGPGRDNTYLTLNRDTVDQAHMKLDCAAMPNIETEVPCYIPALDRHEIIVESAAGITNLAVRYRYGVADVSIIEKVRWGVTLTPEEKTISDSLGLSDAVLAGVM